MIINIESLTFAVAFGKVEVKELFCFGKSIIGRKKKLIDFFSDCKNRQLTIFSEGHFNSYDPSTRDIRDNPWLVAIKGDAIPQTFKATEAIGEIWWLGIFAKVSKLDEDGYILNLNTSKNAAYLKKEANLVGCCY